MAIVNMNEWVPEEWGGALVKKYRQTSALLRATEGPGGRRETMNTDVKHVPVDGGMDVAFTAKGATFPLDDEPGATIELVARKIAAASQLADEDVKDAKGFVNIVENKREAGFSNAALLLDNAALATVGAMTPEPTMTRPYTSVYEAADPGQIQTFNLTTGTGPDFREAIQTAIETAEDSAFATDDIVLLASPGWKGRLRSQVTDGSQGVNLWDPQRDTVLEYPIYWSRSLRLSATATYSPVTTTGAQGTAGNPLIIAIPRSMLIPGIRENLAWRVTDPQHGPGLLSDSWYLTIRQRTAFAVGDGTAAGIVEGVTA